ncbi:hypothetical protein P7K49_033366 [Saguinus oedipus]|uniref:Uncharacterized protein n=1 Tax=Saguinus oedipus TaxID=9490 RepID=A0ABQ9TS42_SAGOE|nr:hypothetical protein P7K49_033366 [Saguinus oedipus]
MAGLPNFGGAGEGREGRARCQQWPRLSDPGRCSLSAPPPPPNFPRLKLFGPIDPGCCGMDSAGLGNPLLSPGGGRGGRQLRTQQTVLRPHRRVSLGHNSADVGALQEHVPPPAKFPAWYTAAAKAARMPVEPPHSPRAVA